jgi:hypothetical protein
MTKLLKLQQELVMNGQKIMCMRMEPLVFPDSVSFLTCALRKLPDALDLQPESPGTHIISTRVQTGIMWGQFPTLYLRNGRYERLGEKGGFGMLRLSKA